MIYNFDTLKNLFTYEIAIENLKSDIENSLKDQYTVNISVNIKSTSDHTATATITAKLRERDLSQKDIEDIIRSYAKAKNIDLPEDFDDVSNELIAKAIDDYTTYDYEYLRRKMPEFVKDYINNYLFSTGEAIPYDIINNSEKDNFTVDVILTF